MSRLRVYVALAIAGIWAVSYAVSFATNNYAGVSVITPVMLVAAAYLLGSGIDGKR